MIDAHLASNSSAGDVSKLSSVEILPSYFLN